LLELDDTRLMDARMFYESAVAINEALTKADPENRVYKMELAKYCDNLSHLLGQLGEADLAQSRSQEALDLLEALALPAPSLAIEQADAHNLRGRLLEAKEPRAALAEYQMSFDMFGRLWREKTAHYSAPVHQRYVDLLSNVARLAHQQDSADVHALLLRGFTAYLDFGAANLTPNGVADTRLVVENVSSVLQDVPERDRAEIVNAHRALQAKLAAYK